MLTAPATTTKHNYYTTKLFLLPLILLLISNSALAAATHSPSPTATPPPPPPPDIPTSNPTTTTISVTSTYTSLLILALSCILQPHGSLIFSDGGGSKFWRLSPIAAGIEALHTFRLFIEGYLSGLSFHETCLAMLLTRQPPPPPLGSRGGVIPKDFIEQFSTARWGWHVLSVVVEVLLFVRAAAATRMAAAVAAVYVMSWACVEVMHVSEQYRWSGEGRTSLPSEKTYSVSEGWGKRRVDSSGVMELVALWGLIVVPLCWLYGGFIMIILMGTHAVDLGPDVEKMVLFVLCGVLMAMFLFWIILVNSRRVREGMLNFVDTCVKRSYEGSWYCLGTFVCGSLAFFMLYREEDTIRPVWMEWMG
ncbi:hypothetical protein K440DRAFT_29613 [Wilcoxina mikolae CBS 423.85]|nr:hypothetical protein K440DRAFT_29613 [Wilcoxina mikolae CBS 423.85]